MTSSTSQYWRKVYLKTSLRQIPLKIVTHTKSTKSRNSNCSFSLLAKRSLGRRTHHKRSTPARQMSHDTTKSIMLHMNESFCTWMSHSTHPSNWLTNEEHNITNWSPIPLMNESWTLTNIIVKKNISQHISKICQVAELKNNFNILFMWVGAEPVYFTSSVNLQSLFKHPRIPLHRWVCVCVQSLSKKSHEKNKALFTFCGKGLRFALKSILFSNKSLRLCIQLERWAWIGLIRIIILLKRGSNTPNTSICSGIMRYPFPKDPSVRVWGGNDE